MQPISIYATLFMRRLSDHTASGLPIVPQPFVGHRVTRITPGGGGQLGAFGNSATVSLAATLCGVTYGYRLGKRGRSSGTDRCDR
jgi:hypothetical protein